MADPHSPPDATDLGPGSAAHPGMPRWAKVSVITAVAALLVAFVLMHLLSGGMGGH